MATIPVTKDNFTKLIENNETVFFDFWAPWCGPCRWFAPIYEKVAEEHPDIVFAKCNTEDQPELAGALGIQAIPTLMVFKGGIGIFNQPGALPEAAFVELVEKVEQVDIEEIKREVAREQEQAANG